eukprot:g52000.t1
MKLSQLCMRCMMTAALGSLNQEITRSDRGDSGCDGQEGRRVKRGPEMFGLSLLILVVLCLQNAGFTLLRRYSQGVLKEDINYSSVLMAGEVIKLVASAIATGWFGQSEPSDIQKMKGLSKLWYLTLNSKKMIVLVAIYGLMNLLSFISIKRINATEFTIAAQTKILTTAVFFVVLLGRPLSNTKWRALVLLICGVILVSDPDKPVEQKTGSTGDRIIGFAAVFAETTLSGFASVYFEKVIKSSEEKLTIWDRNFQLALFSVIFYVASYVVECYNANIDPDPAELFAHWSMITVWLSVLSAIGGILVALTFKYANAILKTLAVSVAVILTTVGGWFFLDSHINNTIAVGAAVTVCAILDYNFDATPDKATPENDKKNSDVSGDKESNEELEMLVKKEKFADEESVATNRRPGVN